MISQNDFICIDVDPKMIKRANDRAFNIGELKNSNAITGDEEKR